MFKESKADNHKSFANGKFIDVCIFVFVIMFVAMWFYISFLKFYSFNDYYGDLGQNTSYLISIFNTRNLTTLFHEVRPQSYFSLVIAIILGIFPSAVTLITLQILATGASVLFLYFYSRKVTNKKLISFIISVSYSLSFSVNATLWQGYGHIMQFFPFLFFLALLFEERNEKIYFFLIVMAAITNIVTLLSIIILLTIRGIDDIKKRNNKKTNFLKRFKISRIITLFFLLIPIILYLIQENLTAFVSFNSGTVSGSLSFLQLVNFYLYNIIHSIQDKILVLFLIIVPFLFLWNRVNVTYLILLPVFVFLLFSNYGVGFFNLQFYISSMLPPLLIFLFLQKYSPTCEVSKYKVVRKAYSDRTRTNEFKIKRLPKREAKKSAVLFLLVATLIISLFYAPWGPLNSQTIPGQDLNAYYNFAQDIHLTNSDIGADKFLSIIPSNATVLIQNNMPIFSNRDRNYLFGPDLIPINNTNFSPGPVPRTNIPQFIITENNSVWYTFPFQVGGNMEYWFNYYTTTYHYGIRAISGNYVLYELYYQGNVSVYM